MPSVKRTRFLSSATANMFLTLSWSIKGLGKPKSQVLPQHLCLAAGGGDLLRRLAAELVGADRQRLGDVAARQHLDPDVALHQAFLAQQLGCHLDAGLEAVRQRIEVDDLVLLAERVVEPALRHAPVQRHLAAFEPALLLEAGARLRALVPAAGRLALPRALTAADALL